MRRVRLRRFALVCTLAAIAGVPARSQVPGRAGEKYALLVGVREYDPNELRPLPYSEPDVTELARVLKDAGYRQVVTLTQAAAAANGNFRLLPTAANIRATLKGMLDDRDAADTVLVAFAGHGVEPRGARETFFCPMDAKLANRATLVSLEEVYRTMGQSPAGVKLLLVDSCRNDPQSDNSRARSTVHLESVTRPQQQRPPGGVAALFSCSPGERAFEHQRLKHGVFFYYVIEGLKGGADLDRDGTVSVDELAMFAKRRVPDFVKEEYGFDVRQLPVLRGEIGGLPVLVSLEGASRPAVLPPRPEPPRTKNAEIASRASTSAMRRQDRPPGAKPPQSLGETQRGSGTGRPRLDDDLARLLSVTGDPREAIRLGLILSGNVTREDLLDLRPALQAQNAEIVAISSSDPHVLAEAQSAVKNLKRECEVKQDYRLILESKRPDVVVVVAYLRTAMVQDETFGVPVSGATAIERIIAWSSQTGKDSYVSRSKLDQGHWTPDPARTTHPSPPVAPTGLDSSYQNPVQEVKKYARIASSGGVNWEDFEEFLRCVRARKAPPHSL